MTIPTGSKLYDPEVWEWIKENHPRPRVGDVTTDPRGGRWLWRDNGPHLLKEGALSADQTSYGMRFREPPTTLTFCDEGRPVLVIDTRGGGSITVPEGVAVDDAARAVLDALLPMLQDLIGGTKT